MIVQTHQPLRIFVVDDNPHLCAGLERWLMREPGVSWVSTHSDWHLATEEAHFHHPDIVLLDIDLPGTSGIDLIPAFMESCPGCMVIMLSGAVTRAHVERALDQGAMGYITKDQSSRTILDLIHRAAAGELVLCPAALAALRGS